MAEQVFMSVNQEFLMEKLARAERRACYAAPGIHDWVAEAFIQLWPRLGPDNTVVITDPNPFVMQVGYGTEQALARLWEEGIPVRVQPGLRIGVVIADDFAVVFGPPAHNVEVFPTEWLPNAVVLSATEATRLLSAIAPSWNDAKRPEFCGVAPEIGADELTTEALNQIHENLVEHPPVKPDLERQMRVINSIFQIVKITFSGANLAQRKLKLDADAIGIRDADLKRRIGATFKVFEDNVRYVTDDLRRDLEDIKKKYKLKTVGDVGQLVLARDRAGLERELVQFQTKVQQEQERLQKVISKELETGKARLRELLKSSMPTEVVADKEWLDLRLDSMIRRLGYPATEDVLSELECDWNVFHVSEQMINKEEFTKKVEEFYGKPLAQLVKVESAVGVRSANI